MRLRRLRAADSLHALVWCGLDETMDDGIMRQAQDGEFSPLKDEAAQAARGTLDTAPTHAQANGCCTRFAMLRFVRGQACAPITGAMNPT